MIQAIESMVESMKNNYYDSTILYYNRNAAEFCDNTVNANITQIQDLFLSKLEKNSYILDFGCGSGRDTKYFLELGFHVDAVDGSEGLCRLAEKYTGIEVKQMYFQELSEIDKYDGIWACSSILHLPHDELTDVLKKMTKALKQGGVIYTSFKYGTFEGIKDGRYFTYMTKKSFDIFIQEFKELTIEEEWITADARPGRGDEKWLNLILRKS